MSSKPTPTTSEAIRDSGVPLVVCPTSWGADEDFDLFARSARARGLHPGQRSEVRQALRAPHRNRELRGAFEARLARRQFTHIAVRVATIDSHAAIAKADIGLCLHQSASGLDLPLVLSDLRAAGVPACVYDYAPVLTEVLTDGREGVRFGEPGELMALLVAVATNDSSDSPLARSRAWLAAHPAETWEDQWQKTMGRSFLSRVPRFQGSKVPMFWFATFGCSLLEPWNPGTTWNPSSSEAPRPDPPSSRARQAPRPPIPPQSAGRPQW